MRLVGGYLIAATSTAIAAQAPERPSIPDMPQISRTRAPLPQSPAVPRTGEAPPQLTAEKLGSPEPTQLTAGPRTGASSPQLSTGAPTAQPSPPLSSTRDGRTAAVDRLKGEDRCDPRAQTRENAAKCAAVIENRAEAFKGQEPVELSPEQKIILEQLAQEKKDLDTAARRLAASGNDADSIEAQGVAFIVLRPPAREEEKPEDKPSQDEAAAAVNAILNPGLNPGTGPQQ
jgi:hypothetical protein